MASKGKPGGRKQQISMPASPSAESRRLRKGHEESKPDSNPKIGQAVVRTVSEGALVHFYLACGHLITVQKGDLKGAAPTEMECWACDMWKSE